VLWAAAVLAKSLDAPRVARIADRSIEETGEILAELARLDILVPTEAIHEPCYGFAHRSLVAATYQKIPAPQRRVFHDRAAEVIADDPAGLDERAEHLFKGSDDARAVEAAIDAGDRAASIYADRRAIAYYARAYARLSGTENPRAAPLAMRLGRLFERSGELERASAWYGAAVTQTTDPLLQIEATLGLGAVAHVRGLPADTEQHAKRALELLKNSPDARLSAIAHRLQALVAHQGGDSVRAEVLLMATLAELESAGAEKEIVEVLLDLARLSRERGEHVRAVRYARRAQHRARARGDSSAIAEASTVLGRGFIRAARFRAAKRALLHGLRVARESGDRLRQGLVLREIGNLKVREGDLEGALERYNRSLELLRASRARPDESAVVHNIGVVRSCLGDYRAALTALQAAIDVSNAAGDIQGIASSTVELGHTYAQLGDLRQARALLGTALQIAGTLSDSVLAVEANALLGWVHVRSGNVSKGQQFIARLDRLLDPLEDPAHRGVALLYAARCAILLADADTASKAVERLSAVVDEGSLDDLRPAATAARGQAAALAGDRQQAIDLLSQAAMQATNHGLRPIEIHVRAALARLLQDSDQAAVQLTRAMELMRDIAGSLSTHHVSTYLSTPEAQQINEDFRRAHKQLLGCPPPAS
jgi:tetratricopeptide (TPR) repeat protein